MIVYIVGPTIYNNIDNIAQSIDDDSSSSSSSISSSSSSSDNSNSSTGSIPFNPITQLFRLLGAVLTLGSGCSLGPEGPAVEIGAGFSRILSKNTTVREAHHLFLAGCSAGVAGGFNAPIAGVLFAIECGNRYLSKNTIKLDEESPDGPRADIAAIVLAAVISDVIVRLGLHESGALSVQGNLYGLESPVLELSLYFGLGLIAGGISASFSKLRDIFKELYEGKEAWSSSLPFKDIPFHLRPILGGLACGIIAVYYPQTTFVGYATLDQLLAGKINLDIPLILELLGLKLFLASFSLGSGLIGGVFAPSLFFGATAGAAYYVIVSGGITQIQDLISHSSLAINDPNLANSISNFFQIASAPAYATVGAAATLGAIFRAPLTSSMLMFELTQNHDIVLPVLLSTGVGGLFGSMLKREGTTKKQEC